MDLADTWQIYSTESWLHAVIFLSIFLVDFKNCYGGGTLPWWLTVVIHGEILKAAAAP
jgi:hypothetical protein